MSTPLNAGTRPLRIVMLTQGYYPKVGGAERQVTAVSQELTRRGVEVHVITRSLPGTPPRETLAGVTVYRLPVPRPKVFASLSFTFNALAVIRRIQPDVLHAHELLSPTTTAVLARQLNRIPVVVTLHGGGEIRRMQQKFFGASRLRYFSTHVERFIAIDADIDTQLASLGIPDRLRVSIPNGVDISRFRPLSPDQKAEMRSQLNLPPGPLVIFTGRLVGLKRVDQLIAAWARVHQEFPQATLLIAGDGLEGPVLKQAAYSGHADSGAQHESGVRFLGEIQDVAPYLQAADLFVLPSRYEGLSVALLESMASGLAAIATDVGGNVDLVNHLQTGWLVSGEDGPELPVRLAEAMQSLLADEPLRSRLAQNGREFVEQFYSLESVAEKLHRLYLTVMDAAVAPGLRDSHSKGVL
jgi:glycosyltransferase involved in cell wall biosynthesis